MNITNTLSTRTIQSQTAFDMHEFTAQQLFIRGEFDAALRSFQDARSYISLESKTQLSQNHLNIARVYFAQGKLTEASGQFHQVIALNDNLGDIQQHFELLKGSKQSAEFIAFIHVQLADVYLARQDFKEAIQQLQEAHGIYEQLEFNSANGAFVHVKIADVRRAQGSLDNFIKRLYRKVTTHQHLDEKDALDLIFLGNFYLSQRNTEEALQFFQRALMIYERLEPFSNKVASILMRIGHIYESIGRQDVALHEFKEALCIYEISNDRQKAYATLGRIISILERTENPQFEYSLKFAKAALATGNRDVFLSLKNQFLTSIQDAINNNAALARSHAEQAVAIFERAITRQEGDLDTAKRNALKELGNFQEALRKIEEQLCRVESIFNPLDTEFFKLKSQHVYLVAIANTFEKFVCN